MTTTAPPIHALDADSSRAEIIEALGHANRDCKRAPHVTAKLSTSPATTWDKRHAWANTLLEMLEDVE